MTSRHSELARVQNSARSGGQGLDGKSSRSGLTLRHWVRRLEEKHAQALQHVDEPTYRVWRLYMSGAAYRFKIRRANVYQTLLVRPDPEGQSLLPLTRADWYSPQEPWRAGRRAAGLHGAL